MHEIGGIGGFSLEGRNPGGPLRPHALAAEQPWGRMRSFPSLSKPYTCPHPYANHSGEQTNGSQATVGLGEQDNQDDPQLGGPVASKLASGEENSKSSQPLNSYFHLESFMC